jgi:hypothetical protein
LSIKRKRKEERLDDEDNIKEENFEYLGSNISVVHHDRESSYNFYYMGEVIMSLEDSDMENLIMFYLSKQGDKK